MTVPIFLELVEMKAKTASVLPFLIGLCFSYYYYGSIHITYVILYFIAMFLFNMAVDVLDNYNDYHHAVDVNDYKKNTNIIGRENLSVRSIFLLMISMATASAVIGFILAWFVGWPLLIMGGFCFAIGVFYSSGPKPLSSLPLGEFFSGFTMGFMISLICVYLNTYHHFSWSFENLGLIFLISLPNTLWISNLMLANNLCDKEEDEKNQRYTLVHYIGVKGGLWLFTISNIVALLAIICEYIVGIAPITILFSLLLIPFVYKQTKLLWRKQVKKETFVCGVKILALGSVVQVATYFLGIII
ncbi:prenyltransferase [Ligilactobacillus sp. WILCCON 0076]|uniref:Prenyltransferase n=1 Tax=Ligilactobacillus ubinensis TaxID=2876789 RepID=A0A9X2JKL9_9LACO|nr:prenyltransferase [Ligilactobacillus ubinensis]MCP0885870.1 prenyltransferase [Ligilactobacillus ubinensis]